MDNQSMRDDQLPATKGDLKELEDRFVDTFATKNDLKQEIKSVRTDVALILDRFTTRIDARFDAMADMFRQTRSDIMAACEKALTTSQKVDRDQVFTRDRLDRLETRVTALESRRKRRPS